MDGEKIINIVETDGVIFGLGESGELYYYNVREKTWMRENAKFER